MSRPRDKGNTSLQFDSLILLPAIQNGETDGEASANQRLCKEEMTDWIRLQVRLLASVIQFRSALSFNV